MLSVVITTFNAQNTLKRAVESVRGIAGEIIIVDTQSSDSTVSLAKNLGCKVFNHKNTRIVEPVRNFSIQKATGDWILILDADEEVPLSLSMKITEIIRGNNYDFVRIPRKNLIFDTWIKSDHWWPDYVYRLFRKGHIKWSDKIHSTPETTGRGLDLPKDEALALIHHHYKTISEYILRLDRYTTIQAEEQLKTSKSDWHGWISKPSGEFFSQYFVRKGYNQGAHGLALSLLQSFSALVVELKKWEQSKWEPKVVNKKEVFSELKKTSIDISWWITEQKISDSQGIAKYIYKLIRKI